jgi:hypothetical protein
MAMATISAATEAAMPNPMQRLVLRDREEPDTNEERDEDAESPPRDQRLENGRSR